MDTFPPKELVEQCIQSWFRQQQLREMGATQLTDDQISDLSSYLAQEIRDTIMRNLVLFFQ